MSAKPRQGETLGPRSFGPFSARDVSTYAAASGDDNPLHVDPAIAARAGLARPPIHGMLLMGCFEPFVRDVLPANRLVKLGAKFIRPVLVDETFEVTGKVVQVPSDGPAVIRLTVKRGGDLVCLAEAFVAP